MNIVSQVNMTT